MSVLGFFKGLFGEDAKKQMAEVIHGPDPAPYPARDDHFYQELLIEEVPLFTIWTARLMLADPCVQIGLATRNAGLSAAEVEVKSSSEEIRNYVQELHNRTWAKYGTKLRKGKTYGYRALQFHLEKSEDDGCLYPTECKAFSPHEVRCLTNLGKPVGFSVPARNTRATERAKILMPRGIWLTYDSEHNPYYGQSILRRSYGPWYEKWMRFGAKRTSQLRFMKDAYIGDQITYPIGRNYVTQDGTQVPWRDIVREVVENRMNGATLVVPKMLDPNGKDLIEYKPPQDTGTPNGILQWIESLDRDIWRGMTVFEEVIQASSSGSGFSGRSVPFLMFLTSINDEWQELLEQLDTMFYRPLVWYQFGGKADYSMQAVPLAETFVSDIAGSSVGGASMGGGHGDRSYPEESEPSE